MNFCLYRGLLCADPLAHVTSGAVELALARSGAFSAKLIVGGKTLRLKGAFDGAGSFVGKVSAGRAASLDVLLALDAATPDAPVTGLVFDGTTAMALNAWPETKFARGTSAPQAGNYTLAVEPGGTAGAPLGYGTGHATVKKNGAVKLAAKLANGSAVSVGSAVTAGGRVPIYAEVDGGSFSAPLTFADKPDSDWDGTAFWASNRARSRKYAFDAFTTEPRIFAQRYTAPERGERAVLASTNGAGTLSLASGATTLTQGFTLGTDNRFTYGSPLLDGFAMTLSAKKGEFSGSLQVGGDKTKFSGVLMQKSDEGVGFSPGGDLRVELGP